MQCVEFEDRLNRLLDHRLSPDDDLQLADHAQQCDACTRMLLAQQRLFAGLRESRLAPPVELADRVLSTRHLETQARRGWWKGAGILAMMATAASLGGLALMAIAARDSADRVAVSPAPPDIEDAPRDSGGGLAIAHLGGRSQPTRKETDERLLEYRQALESLATRIGDPAMEFDDVSETLSPSIRPIQSSFSLAIDALWRTLPRGREAKGSKPESGAWRASDLPVLS
jgi:hypothetical protein